MVKKHQLNACSICGFTKRLQNAVEPRRARPERPRDRVTQAEQEHLLARTTRTVRIKRPTPLSEKTALTLFIETWDKSQKWVAQTAPSEKNGILSVIDKCRNRLSEMQAEAEKMKAEAAKLERNHSEKRAKEIQVTHRKSRLSTWQVRLPGSAFTGRS